MKKKLFAATMSLMCATVMMVSSSFAWFTVSTTADVSNIDVTISAEKNLEIAKATDGTTAPGEVTATDAKDETKWGSKVTSFAAATLQYPATIDSNALKTVQFDTDGRTNGLVAATAPTLSDGVGYYTATIGSNTSTKVGAVFGVWLRSNVDADVTVGQTGGTGVTVALTTSLSSFSGSSMSVALTANTPTLVYIVVYADGAVAAQGNAAAFATQREITDIAFTFTSTDVTNDFSGT